jgi:hypothetical protein
MPCQGRSTSSTPPSTLTYQVSGIPTFWGKWTDAADDVGLYIFLKTNDDHHRKRGRRRHISGTPFFCFEDEIPASLGVHESRLENVLAFAFLGGSMTYWGGKTPFGDTIAQKIISFQETNSEDWWIVWTLRISRISRIPSETPSESSSQNSSARHLEMAYEALRC